MIILQINTENDITVTCSELMLDPTNYVAIRFTNETTYETVECLLDQNFSPSPGRYDVFKITEVPGASADPANGLIHFDRVGHWKYDCFEWPVGLTWSSITNQRHIETGRALVSGTLNVPEVYQ